MAAHPGNDIPNASASEFIESAVPMELQWPSAWRAFEHSVDQLLAGNFAFGQLPARFPQHEPGAGKLAVDIAIEHGAARQDDRGQVHGGSGHQRRGGGLVASRGEDHTIEGISGRISTRLR